VTLASIGLNNNLPDGDSVSPSISADGRFVAFISTARNLVDSDTNGVADVFVRDTCAGAPSGCVASTQRVSVSTGGVQASAASTSAAISATGRFVSFATAAANLSAAGSSEAVFLRDTCAGADSTCTPSTAQIQ
jgi:Tol biopolymer transport system component